MNFTLLLYFIKISIMSFVSAIPNEIWCEIFQGAPRSTINQFTRVCKAWKKTATPLFYDSIVLSGDAVICLRSKIESEKDMDSLVNLKTNCSCVKTFVMRDEPYLLDRMPVLFVFLFSSSKSIDFSKITFVKNIWIFIDCPDSSCLRYIEEIFPPREASPELVNSYYNLCRRYRTA